MTAPVPYKACSGFTHVRSRRIAQPPPGDLKSLAGARRLGPASRYCGTFSCLALIITADTNRIALLNIVQTTKKVASVKLKMIHITIIIIPIRPKRLKWGFVDRLSRAALASA